MITSRFSAFVCGIVALAPYLAPEASAQGPAPASSSNRLIVATVLSENIYADEIEPNAEALDRATTNRKKWKHGPPDAEWIQQYRARQLRTRILRPLSDDYISANDIKASDEDIAAFRQELNVKPGSIFGDAIKDFPESTLKRFEEQQIDFSRNKIISHRFYAALQNEYGGTVYITHMGQPLIDGAIDRFLQAEKLKGNFSILNPELAERVLNTKTNRPGYYPMSTDEAKEALENPWWTRTVQSKE